MLPGLHVVPRANNIYVIFVARAQQNLRICWVKQIAHILGLCIVLHLCHVCVKAVNPNNMLRQMDLDYLRLTVQNTFS